MQFRSLAAALALAAVAAFAPAAAAVPIFPSTPAPVDVSPLLGTDEPAIGFDGAEGLVAAWRSGGTVGGAFRFPGQPFGAPVGTTGSGIDGLKMGVDAFGGAVAVWQQAGPTVFYATRAGGGGWSAPVPLG